jgi:hypothetical protein
VIWQHHASQVQMYLLSFFPPFIGVSPTKGQYYKMDDIDIRTYLGTVLGGSIEACAQLFRVIGIHDVAGVNVEAWHFV